VKAQAAPGFSDYDAVAGVAGVEADLDGKVDADLTYVLGEVGDVLGALVGDAGDAIAIEEHGGGGGGGVRRGWDEPLGFGDAAVGDAADVGEVVAAQVFALGFCNALAGKEIAGKAGDGGEAEAQYSQAPWGAEQQRQMDWKVR
jgi:hypothetical protein